MLLKIVKSVIEIVNIYNNDKQEKIDGFMELLINTINETTENFNQIELSNTLNGLAQLGYKKSDLPKLEIEGIVSAINRNIEKFNKISISNTFNGLAQLGYKKSDLPKLEIEGIVSAINRNIENFNQIELSNTLNGLAQLGYKKSDLPKLEIEGIVSAINRNIEKFNQIELSNTLNGIISLFLYNKSNYEENIATFQPIINSILDKLNEKGFTDNLQTSFVQKNLYYLVNCRKNKDIKLDSLTKLNLLEKSSQEDNEQHELKSTLERDFYESIVKIINENNIRKQYKIQSTKNSKIYYEHEIDFMITIDNKNYYIEIDGPSHYSSLEYKEEVPATQIRNDIISNVIKENYKSKEHKNYAFLTLNPNHFERLKNKILDIKLSEEEKKNEIKTFFEKISKEQNEKFNQDSGSMVEGGDSKNCDYKDDEYKDVSQNKPVSIATIEAKQEDQKLLDSNEENKFSIASGRNKTDSTREPDLEQPFLFGKKSRFSVLNQEENDEIPEDGSEQKRITDTGESQPKILKKRNRNNNKPKNNLETEADKIKSGNSSGYPLCRIL